MSKQDPNAIRWTINGHSRREGWFVLRVNYRGSDPQHRQFIDKVAEVLRAASAATYGPEPMLEYTGPLPPLEGTGPLPLEKKEAP